MTISDLQIEAAVSAIIASRDFCGDERSAAYDALAESGVPANNRESAYRIANFRANAEWNRYQRAAGVPEKRLF